jgi:hypothetical protein
MEAKTTSFDDVKPTDDIAPYLVAAKKSGWFAKSIKTVRFDGEQRITRGEFASWFITAYTQSRQNELNEEPTFTNPYGIEKETKAPLEKQKGKLESRYNRESGVARILRMRDARELTAPKAAKGYSSKEVEEIKAGSKLRLDETPEQLQKRKNVFRDWLKEQEAKAAAQPKTTEGPVIRKSGRAEFQLFETEEQTQKRKEIAKQLMEEAQSKPKDVEIDSGRRPDNPNSGRAPLRIEKSPEDAQRRMEVLKASKKKDIVFPWETEATGVQTPSQKEANVQAPVKTNEAETALSTLKDKILKP